jgi:hypothetical protein
MVGDGYPGQRLDGIRVNTSDWPPDKGNTCLVKLGVGLKSEVARIG